MNFTFSKQEKLCSRKAIETLISEGNSLFVYPFKVLWTKTNYPQEYPVQIAFAVPKRRHKRANARNTIKRRARESFRLNKHSLYEALNLENTKIQILLVYIANEELPYHEINAKLIQALDQILAAVQASAK